MDIVRSMINYIEIHTIRVIISILGLFIISTILGTIGIHIHSLILKGLSFGCFTTVMGVALGYAILNPLLIESEA